MVRINKQEIKGNTDARKKSSEHTENDNDNFANEENENIFCCEGDECHLDWNDD